MSDPLVLGFDTSAAHCAAALLSGDRVLDERHEDIARGQAERLMPMLEEMLAAQGATWRDLDRIGVGTGPGNFTGIRISVSAARGLALALGIPAVGVTMFEVLRAAAPEVPDVLATLAAPRERLYAQRFRDGAEPPVLIDPDAPPDSLTLHTHTLVIGQGAGRLAAHFGVPAQDVAPQAIGRRIARKALLTDCFACETFPRPAPLYIRPADAAPPREAPPAILR